MFTEPLATFSKEQCDPSNKMFKNKSEDPRMLNKGVLRGPQVQLIHLTICGPASPHWQCVTKLNLAPMSFSFQ